MRNKCRWFRLHRAAMLALLSALAATPLRSFANPPLTRAQVQNELAELESAGYDPTIGDDSRYPQDLLDAEQRLARRHTEAARQHMSVHVAAN